MKPYLRTKLLKGLPYKVDRVRGKLKRQGYVNWWEVEFDKRFSARSYEKQKLRKEF